MSDPRERQGDIERIGYLLCHPVRVSLIREYARRPASPTEASESLGIPLGNISYHTKVLFDGGDGLVEVVGKQQVRGAVETFYRLKPLGKRTAAKTARKSVRETASLRAIELVIDLIASGENGAELRGATADGIVRVRTNKNDHGDGEQIKVLVFERIADK